LKNLFDKIQEKGYPFTIRMRILPKIYICLVI